MENNEYAKGGYVTYKNKYNAKYGYSESESHSLEQISKDTGVSMKGLQQIYNKGIGAYKTNPTSVRPNVKSKEQWAMARVYSSVMGGKASKVDANELKMENGGLIAPNGKKSNLTALQYKLVRTKAFKDWFGDWENNPSKASKVVDENGEPLVVYHGTNAEFYKFDKSKGKGSIKQKSINFSSKKEVSKDYGSRILECFLNIRNPYIKNYNGESYWTIGDSARHEKKFDEIPDQIVNKTFDEKIYDGVIFLTIKDSKSRYSQNVPVANNYYAFNNKQIKLADGTNTTFDGNNPDIRFDGGGKVEDLISQGVVELKMFDTKPEHAKEYGLDSVNPLYVQSLCITENQRLKGIGNKVLKYIDDYAIKNGHDVVFGHITQKAEFTKDNRQTFFCDIDMIKNWLHSKGYAINNDNNDFHKIFNPDIRFNGGGLIENELSIIIKGVTNENKYKGNYKKIFDLIEKDLAFYNPYGTSFEKLIGNDFYITISPKPELSIIDKISKLQGVEIVDNDIRFNDGGLINLKDFNKKMKLDLQNPDYENSKTKEEKHRIITFLYAMEYYSKNNIIPLAEPDNEGSIYWQRISINGKEYIISFNLYFHDFLNNPLAITSAEVEFYDDDYNEIKGVKFNDGGRTLTRLEIESMQRAINDPLLSPKLKESFQKVLASRKVPTENIDFSRYPEGKYIDPYDFSGYEYMRSKNEEMGVSFLLTGEYELVSKAIFEQDYAMWLFYNYLGRINISFSNCLLWLKQAQAYFINTMPVQVALTHQPKAKDGRSYAMWFTTSDANKEKAESRLGVNLTFEYNGSWYCNEIGMVGNYDYEKGKGWGTFYEERKTGLLVPEYTETSFHFNTLIHEFAHCYDFQSQLVDNIKKFKDKKAKIDSGEIVLDTEEMTDLEKELYGSSLKKKEDSVTRPITNHFEYFIDSLIKILRACASGEIPLTQKFEQQALDVQTALSGVYGDLLVEQRERKRKEAMETKKIDELRENTRFTWQGIYVTEILNYIEKNAIQKGILDSLSKRGVQRTFTLSEIIEFDNLITQYANTDFRIFSAKYPSKSSKLYEDLKAIKSETNRIINNHYDNIRKNYEYGFYPNTDLDKYLEANCNVQDFRDYKSWKECNQKKLLQKMK